VLFCDLVGSTELAARLDPEDMGEVIRAYQECCAEVVRAWGGHVAKYMGDGVLTYFGWPQAHEDAAERAVRAGPAIIAALARMETPAGEPLGAKVGIGTGLVMVGELIGEGVALEQTVVGDTPNLAARLQGLAAPGRVVISQATRRLVGGLFELTDLGPQRLKGFAEPLAAWRVEGEGRAEGRFEALHGERLTPLVGREHELGILLERWAWAKDGDGQVILLAGEPGIGKSRVVRALRERLGDEPYTLLTHYCSPYNTNSALHPVIAQLERAARLDRDEPAEAQLAKLEAVLARSSNRPDETVPLLAALVGVPTGDRYPTLTLTPEVQKRRTLQALADQLAGLAAQRPVLALYEDVHWIDPSTLDLLGMVIERIRRLPVLVLITFRPEFHLHWTGQAHVTTVTMSRLGRHQGADLVVRVAGAKPLPAAIVEQIVARTDGVPLFIEELTKTVLESGLLANKGDRYELSGPLPPLAIPTTLHDSLMARRARARWIGDPRSERRQGAAGRVTNSRPTLFSSYIVRKCSEVLPPGFEDGKFPTELIQNVKAWLDPDLADAGERQIEPTRESLDLLPLCGRRCEQQLVVVAAGQRGVAGAGQVARGGRERQLIGVHLGADPGDVKDVPEVGDETVRDIDRRARDAAQRLAERETRPGQAIALDEVGTRLVGDLELALQHLQAQRGVAERAGDPDVVARFGPRAQQGRASWYLSDRGEGQGERPGRCDGVAAEQGDPERRIISREAGAKLAEPLVADLLGAGESEQVAERRCAHRRQIRQVDAKELLRDLPGRVALQEVHARDHGVLGQHQLPAGRGIEQRGIVGQIKGGGGGRQRAQAPRDELELAFGHAGRRSGGRGRRVVAGGAQLSRQAIQNGVDEPGLVAA
jgi:class 3 adenylate cyclase